jgi:hypothetical protein
MIYIEAFSTKHKPSFDRDCYGKVSLFLAGSISESWNWQEHVASKLEKTDLVVINPRREFFDTSVKEEANRQIKWEFDHLAIADMVLFWFSHETLAPITLLEYGKTMMTRKKLFVGCDPAYKRKLDIEVQTELERPGTSIHNNIDALAESVIFYVNAWS